MSARSFFAEILRLSLFSPGYLVLPQRVGTSSAHTKLTHLRTQGFIAFHTFSDSSEHTFDSSILTGVGWGWGGVGWGANNVHAHLRTQALTTQAGLLIISPTLDPLHASISQVPSNLQRTSSAPTVNDDNRQYEHERKQ